MGCFNPPMTVGLHLFGSLLPKNRGSMETGWGGCERESMYERQESLWIVKKLGSLLFYFSRHLKKKKLTVPEVSYGFQNSAMFKSRENSNCTDPIRQTYIMRLWDPFMKCMHCLHNCPSARYQKWNYNNSIKIVRLTCNYIQCEWWTDTQEL